tara:strand:+ start:291 stop:479 length:189 start_codon:yes stop_codon:yes gene_type:complete
MTEAIAGLSSNDQILWKEVVEMKQLFSLYLEHRKETEKFSKFVKAKVEEFENKQRSKITKGT